MKKEIISVFLMLSLFTVFFIPKANAQLGYLYINAWTDKVVYNPGDSGKLILSLRNEHPTDTIEVHNITIVFNNWFAYVKDHWEGNQTIKMSPYAFVGSKGGTFYKDDITFTVPTDGRAISTGVSITIGTNKGYDTGSANVNVATASYYGGIYEMDKLITLLTVQQVIIIICAIIVAAAVFIGVRSAFRKAEAPKA